MSRFQVTVTKDQKYAIIRTLERHGQGPVNPSLFQGSNRMIVELH